MDDDARQFDADVMQMIAEGLPPALIVDRIKGDLDDEGLLNYREHLRFALGEGMEQSAEPIDPADVVALMRGMGAPTQDDDESAERAVRDDQESSALIVRTLREVLAILDANET